MRRIGVLGGMSWESTAEYYRLLNTLVAERLGGLHSADVILRSVDFATIEALQAAGRWDEAGAVLAAEAKALEAAGADVLVLATNTMHLVADRIEQAVGIPLVHLVDVTAAAVAERGLSRVGLLATAFTMEQPFYADRMARHGITVQVPDEADRAEVHRVIYDELCRGLVLESSFETFLAIVGRLVGAGCEGVVLGCTEIELLLPLAQVDGVPLFPTTRLHCAAAVDAALSP
jgi:aspartate racemase